jgi:hypothetical protein
MSYTLTIDDGALEGIPLTCATSPIEFPITETRWVFVPPLPIQVVSAVLEEIKEICDKQHGCRDCPFGRIWECLQAEPWAWNVPAIADALKAHREASHE